MMLLLLPAIALQILIALLLCPAFTLPRFR